MGINQNVLLCFQDHTTCNQYAKFRTILTSGLGDMSDLLSSLLVPTITYVETCTYLLNCRRHAYNIAMTMIWVKRPPKGHLGQFSQWMVQTRSRLSSVSVP